MNWSTHPHTRFGPRARILATTAVLLTLIVQSVASAAPAVTPTSRVVRDSFASISLAKDTKQAALVVQLAEQRPVAIYFINGGDAKEIARFNSDLANVAIANSLLGIGDSALDYQVWYVKNQTSLILARNKMRTGSLQGFFYESFLAFKIEQTNATQKPNAFFDKLAMIANNPFVYKVSVGTMLITIGILKSASSIIKGSLIAGPSAGTVSAFLDPLVRPVKEKAAVIGGRLLGRPGAWLYSRLFQSNVSAQDLAKMESGLEVATQGTAEARELVNKMGYDMSPTDFAKNVEKMQDIWNETNRAWAMYTPSGFKDGRSLASDAIMFRPMTFTTQTNMGVVGAETFRHTIDAMSDRIIARNGADPKIVDGLFSELLKAVEERERSEQKSPPAAEERVKAAEHKLLEIGATPEQVERIVMARATELALARHAAASLAAQVIHDFQYQEFNRSLPEVATASQQVLRFNYSLNFFHREFKTEVARILNEMDFKIEVLGSEVKTRKAPKLVPNRVPEEKAVVPSAKPAARRTGAVEFVRSRTAPARARAMGALSKLNALRSNRVAVERGADVRKPDEQKTLRERAADSIRLIRK